jgi:iron complex outermembrane receptor protein
VFGISNRDNYYQSGYVKGQGLLDGLKERQAQSIRPAGCRRQSLSGIDQRRRPKNRTSKSTFTGIDVTASRALMDLPGGALALALGADLHRDTTEDTKLPLSRSHLRQHQPIAR